MHEQTYSCYKDVSRADLIARFEVLDADINLVRMLHSLHTIYEGADGGNLILQFSQRGHLLIHQVADQEATEAYFRLEKDNPGDDIVLVRSALISGNSRVSRFKTNSSLSAPNSTFVPTNRAISEVSPNR